MGNVFWVAFGGALGSALRFTVEGTMRRWAGGLWPIGTLAVNVIGSFAIGILFHIILLRELAPAYARFFLITGLLGGFTTFSAFSLETFELLQQGKWPQALLYAGLSLGGGLGAAWLGFVSAAPA